MDPITTGRALAHYYTSVPPPRSQSDLGYDTNSDLDQAAGAIRQRSTNWGPFFPSPESEYQAFSASLHWRLMDVMEYRYYDELDKLLQEWETLMLRKYEEYLVQVVLCRDTYRETHVMPRLKLSNTHSRLMKPFWRIIDTVHSHKHHLCAEKTADSRDLYLEEIQGGPNDGRKRVDWKAQQDWMVTRKQAVDDEYRPQLGLAPRKSTAVHFRLDFQKMAYRMGPWYPGQPRPSSTFQEMYVNGRAYRVRTQHLSTGRRAYQSITPNSGDEPRIYVLRDDEQSVATTLLSREPTNSTGRILCLHPCDSLHSPQMET